jgi:hypothetical protein
MQSIIASRLTAFTSKTKATVDDFIISVNTDALFEKEQIEFAFPTQTILVNKQGQEAMYRA